MFNLDFSAPDTINCDPSESAEITELAYAAQAAINALAEKIECLEGDEMEGLAMDLRELADNVSCIADATP